MQQGTKQDAIALAKTRWAALHPFDLSEESWQQVFEEHRPGDILQAIKRTSATRDTRPEKIYAALLLFLERLVL